MTRPPPRCTLFPYTTLFRSDVDGAVRRVSGGWASTGQDWAYDGDRYARVAAERSREQQAMLGYIRSEEHTSELQSHSDLVCRLLLEKKNSPKSNTKRCE